MAGDGSEFAGAFDDLLDKNWQRLDELYGGNRETRATQAATPPAAQPGTGMARRFGTCEGLKFSFDI
jgi:hypothetical protein